MTIEAKIAALKKTKNAVILAHYYQRPEVQQIADYVGDSYYLSKVARQVKQKLIVFCGVHFMAESAKILSPHKKILLSAAQAGCPMANMASVPAVMRLKEKHPDAAVVCYINSTAQVKAICDVCVTSANALAIIRSLPQHKIIFLPDRNLSFYVASQCPDKQFIHYPGYCIVHHRVMPEIVLSLKQQHPNAPVAAHPECRKEVLALADFVGSTGAILNYAANSPAPEFIIITEEGIRYELEKQNPGKKFHFPHQAPMICVNMKKTNLENVLWVLEDECNEIEIDGKIRQQASGCLEKMHLLAN